MKLTLILCYIAIFMAIIVLFYTSIQCGSAPTLEDAKGLIEDIEEVSGIVNDDDSEDE